MPQLSKGLSLKIDIYQVFYIKHLSLYLIFSVLIRTVSYRTFILIKPSSNFLNFLKSLLKLKRSQNSCFESNTVCLRIYKFDKKKHHIQRIKKMQVGNKFIVKIRQQWRSWGHFLGQASPFFSSEPVFFHFFKARRGSLFFKFKTKRGSL